MVMVGYGGEVIIRKGITGPAPLVAPVVAMAWCLIRLIYDNAMCIGTLVYPYAASPAKI